MNAPANTRPFSLIAAQQGHPLITRAGAIAKFIAYVDDVTYHQQLVVSCYGYIVTYKTDGTYREDSTESGRDLFLAPLGYCQGLPVFAGDKLIGPCGDIVASVDHLRDVDPFGLAKWPSKLPVVETQMSEKELRIIYDLHCGDPVYSMTKAIANKAIERAIADGDVVPTKEVYRLLDEVKTKYDSAAGRNESYYCAIEFVMDDYLDGLK